MTPSSTCDVCGTVNVLQTGRCIACGQPMTRPTPPVPAPAPAPSVAVPNPPRRTGPAIEDVATATTGTHGETAADSVPGAPADAATPEGRTEPVEDTAFAAARAAAAAPPPPPPAPAPAARPSRPAAEPVDLDDSALRRTVVEPVARPAAPPPVPAEPPAPPVPASRPSSHTLVAETPARPAPSRAPEPVYLIRLLLPEGDKRGIEVGGEPVRIGSGLDEVGLPGDPRLRPSEGTLVVADGKLWLDVAPGSTGIYRRIDGEETLEDGDVVLVGDIAAAFQSTPAAPPASPDVQVLGGVSGSPCGRLVFLRRDGSPGPVHDLPLGRTILGRTDGHINFPADSRLSRRHARFHAADGHVTVEDLDSRNGTYLRVRARRRIDTGDALRIGSAGVQIRSSG